MSFNEYKIQQSSQTASLRTGEAKIDFSSLPKADLQERMDLPIYSKFRIKSGPAGEEGTRSVFIKVDRSRLSFMDSLLFYPLAIGLIIFITITSYRLPFIGLGGITLFDWYPPFWMELIKASKEFITNSYANAFAVFGFVDCFITVIFQMFLYLSFKFLIGWTPSLTWRLIFKVMRKG